jgi:hypothetical protein
VCLHGPHAGGGLQIAVAPRFVALGGKRRHPILPCKGRGTIRRMVEGEIGEA